MQVILLGILALIVLIFCIVDLWHLNAMLKTLTKLVNYTGNMITDIAEIRKRGLYRDKRHFKHNRGYKNIKNSTNNVSGHKERH